MKKNIPNFLKSKKTIILIISLLLFIILTYITFNNKINTIDQKVIDYILNIREDNLTNTMMIITNISSAYALIVISILLLAIIKNKKIPISISKNLIIVFIISQLFKIIIKRPRPININLVEASGFSYPSGHSMVSMAYFGLIAYLIYKNLNNKLAKIILIISLLITIILIGFSRIYLGVHYLSDVIAGFLLAIAYLTIYIKIDNKNKEVK